MNHPSREVYRTLLQALRDANDTMFWYHTEKVPRHLEKPVGELWRGVYGAFIYPTYPGFGASSQAKDLWVRASRDAAITLLEAWVKAPD